MAKKTATQYAKVLFFLTQDLSKDQLSSALDVFTRYLAKEQAVTMLPNIIDEFFAVSQKAEGGVTAAITTAHEASKKELEAIAGQLGEKVQHTHTVDVALVGGFIAQTDSLRLDASITNTLQRFRSHLVS